MFNLTLAYRHCQRITRREAKNFAFAFIFLPRPKQRAMNAVYAFARLVDDIADDEYLSDEEKEHRLDLCRQEVDQLLTRGSERPIFDALADTVRRFSIPISYFHELIDGMEMDLRKTRYETEEGLLRYCYLVASVVGLITIEIFGYSHEEARKYAIDLGLAMQITNILRDVAEDLERDRLYLPADLLEEYGVTEDALRRGDRGENFQSLMKYLAEKAHQYYLGGEKLLPYLDRNARFCPATLGAIYRSVLYKMESERFDIFRRRTRISNSHKLLLAGQMWVKSKF